MLQSKGHGKISRSQQSTALLDFI